MYVPTCMVKIVFFVVASLLPIALFGQHRVLVYGQNIHINCETKPLQFEYKNELNPEDIKQFSYIFIFSTVRSELSENQLSALYDFVTNGGSLYVGADNFPFVSECNQITNAFFGKSFWGNSSGDTAVVNENSCTNQLFTLQQKIPSGKTIVTFPMDYRLKVEAWSADEPLILSAKIGKGKLVLDGGYARFKNTIAEENCLVLCEILRFLTP